MRISNIGIVKAVSAAAFTAALAACGGGGGSSGTVSAEYQISLRADKTELPVNIANVQAGQGVYRPFTTTLYVQATKNGQPIPGGEKIFACNVAGGLNAGSLYYLDGDPAHEKEIDDGKGGKITVPLAYRSITLGSNSGGASFHFHAGNQAGTSTISCSVNDPRDNNSKSASVNITVGATTQKAARIQAVAQAPGYLGTQNAIGIANQVAMQAMLLDDANQQVVNSGAPNVQVSIRSDLGAGSGARLVAGNQSGSVLQLKTDGTGVASFALISGNAVGPIVLEYRADRGDNSVANGIQDPIFAVTQVYAVNEIASTPLSTSNTDLGTLTNGVPFAYALAVSGGVPPYQWSVTGLPNGLSADGTGLISGTPKAQAGAYGAKATVTDQNGQKSTLSITLKLTGEHLPINPDDFVITGCSSTDINTACALPGATPGNTYTYAFTASVGGVTWSVSGLPAWLKNGTAGTAGFITGTPQAPDNCGSSEFLVTAQRGVMSVTRKVAVTVAGGTPPNRCP
ncbi:MAG: hypothetical protein KGM60_02770 [Comamonadaceae bacterium]|nr:hypothetical protein [Comamonadaceae bacterium]